MLLQDGDFKRAVCQISKNCASGGGGGSTLIDGNGTYIDSTDKSINVGLDFSTIGTTNKGLLTKPTYLVYGDIAANTYAGISIPGQSNIQILNSNVSDSIGMILQSGNNIIIQKSTGGSLQQLQFNPDNSIILRDSVAGVGIQYAANYADNYTDRSLVDKQYVEANSGKIVPTVSSTDPIFPEPTLTAGVYYTYFGTENATWTLPNLYDNAGARIGVINDSDFDITLNSFAGDNDIFNAGTKTNVLTISAGEVRIFLSDYRHWVIIN